MKTDATVNNEKQVVLAFTRAAYTMREFAALFGKQVTWAYRMMYDGKIKVIPSSAVRGEFMVPRSEVERLQSQATTYSDEIAGKPVPRKTVAIGKARGQR